MKPAYMRFVLWLFTHVLYKLHVLHPDRLPEKGGALLVSNHVSFVDVLLILSSTRRFVRFLVPEEICARRWLKPWLRLLRVIPLPNQSNEPQLDRALGRAAEAIRKGDVVGIFAERNITRIGILLPFHREFERIMEGLDAPVVPVCLDGVWGSIFSYQAGRFFWKLPRRLPYPVSVSFGEPMRATAKAVEVRAVIQNLQTEAWEFRRETMQPLGRAFITCARHHPFRFAMADARVPGISFSSALAKSLYVARRLRPHWPSQQMVGLFLPPSVGGALANLAVLLAGKIPVNLNYTASEATLASCAWQCELKTIISSKAFLERVKVPLPLQPLLLEELLAKPHVLERLSALILTFLAPKRLVEKAAGLEKRPALDDTAVIVFSSGSTGDPKGIMLSHYNLGSNSQQLCQMFDFGPQDRFAGILPFFHSFGLTATLVVPATHGIGVVFHPNPLEPKPIGQLVRKYRLTYLMATPVFLQRYLRSCEPEDFGSLRFVMTGAEKLQERLAQAFQEKFGLRPAEGYGCTECSPVVAGNTHDFRAAGIGQKGAHQGSIGHPMPGVSVRIVDPDTGVALPLGEPGLLLVRGPNVMKGYLGRPEKTAEVLKDGWYNTGDIASINEDGFLQITDRLSRFSKIAGEMVPHVMVEEKLQQLAGTTEPVFAVTGVPDEQKGERLVVLHKVPEPELAQLLLRLPQMDLPNLWIPKPGQFIRVEQIPTLGSGKLDLQAIKETAKRLSRAPREAEQNRPVNL